MSPTRAQLARAALPAANATMSNARGVVKTPVWLKRFVHQGWTKSFRKWKGDQTESAVAAYLAKAPVEEASKIIKAIVECEEVPTHVSCSIFRRYRRQKVDAPKGRINKKNIMVIDAEGVWREQAEFAEFPPVPTLTSWDIDSR